MHGDGKSYIVGLGHWLRIIHRYNELSAMQRHGKVRELGGCDIDSIFSEIVWYIFAALDPCYLLTFGGGVSQDNECPQHDWDKVLKETHD